MATKTVRQTWLDRVRLTLGLTQEGLGRLLGVSRRTVVRWRGDPSYISTAGAERLVAALVPRDPSLAQEMAKMHHVAWSFPSPNGDAAKATTNVDAAHLVDSIVCAAAEAMAVTPQAVRPALLAAFERAHALRVAAMDVCAQLKPRA